MMRPVDPASLRIGAAPVKRAVSILGLIEWAFQRECAELDFGDIDRLGGHSLPGVGAEYVLMQRGPRGGRIDGGGRSWPHDDAELVADAVAHLPITHGGRGMALQIAELARAGARPDAMVGAHMRMVPAAWHDNQHGRRPATVWTAELGLPGPHWNERRGRKGNLIREKVMVTPVVVTPTSDQIGRARRNYLLWWGALLDIRQSLEVAGLLSAYALTDHMPPMTPWRNNCCL